MIFMFDAGMNSFPAFFEYKVSPVRGFTISTPQFAFRKSGCEVRESIVCRNSAREEPGRTVFITVTQALSARGARVTITARTARREKSLSTIVVYSLL